MKLSIFYFVYACILAIIWCIGYNQSYGYHYLHQIFSCMMVGHFAMEIRAKRRAKEISEALHKAMDRVQRFFDVKFDEDLKNKIKNN